MAFPNASKGLKRIFTAEVIGLIAMALLLLATFLMFPKADSEDVDQSSTGMLIFFGSSMLALFASFVVNITGLTVARRDDRYFRVGFRILIADIILNGILTLVLPIVSFGILLMIEDIDTMMSVGEISALITSILSVITKLADGAIKVFVVLGIVNISKQLGDSERAESGRKLVWVLAVTVVVETALTAVVSAMGGKAASVEALIISIPSVVLVLFQYVIYLSYLSDANKMLSDNGN